MITSICSNCRTSLNFKTSQAGRRFRCPECGHASRLPSGTGEVAAHDQASVKPRTLVMVLAIAVGVMATLFVGVSARVIYLAVSQRGTTQITPATETPTPSLGEHSPTVAPTQTNEAGTVELPIPPPTTDPTYQGIRASQWALGLTDADPDMFDNCQRALVSIGDPAVAHVEPFYRSSPKLNKVNAMAVLVILVQKYASKDALAVFVRAANSPDAYTRFVAMYSIERCGPSGINAWPIVEKLTHDTNQSTADAAKKALAAIKKR